MAVRWGFERFRAQKQRVARVVGRRAVRCDREEPGCEQGDTNGSPVAAVLPLRLGSALEHCTDVADRAHATGFGFDLDRAVVLRRDRGMPIQGQQSRVGCCLGRRACLGFGGGVGPVASENSHTITTLADVTKSGCGLASPRRHAALRSLDVRRC